MNAADVALIEHFPNAKMAFEAFVVKELKDVERRSRFWINFFKRSPPRLKDLCFKYVFESNLHVFRDRWEIVAQTLRN
jgi:hypothetical protein